MEDLGKNKIKPTLEDSFRVSELQEIKPLSINHHIAHAGLTKKNETQLDKIERKLDMVLKELGLSIN